MASGTIKAVASKADVNALNDQLKTKRTPSISSFSSDTEILTWENGSYMVALSSSSSYVPYQWGTLILNFSGVSYGTAMFVTADGRVYTRQKKNNSEWHGAWEQLAVNDQITAINSKFAWTTYLNESNVSVGDAYASTGKSFTLTSIALVRIDMSYSSGRPLAIGVKVSESAGSASVALNSVYGADIADTSGISVTALLTAGTYYVWARTASATGRSNILVTGMSLGA